MWRVEHGVIIMKYSRAEVENRIICEFYQCFSLTEDWIKLSTGELVDVVGLVGDSYTAEEIIVGGPPPTHTHF